MWNYEQGKKRKKVEYRKGMVDGDIYKFYSIGVEGIYLGYLVDRALGEYDVFQPPSESLYLIKEENITWI